MREGNRFVSVQELKNRVPLVEVGFALYTNINAIVDKRQSLKHYTVEI